MSLWFKSRSCLSSLIFVQYSMIYFPFLVIFADFIMQRKCCIDFVTILLYSLFANNDIVLLHTATR